MIFEIHLRTELRSYRETQMAKHIYLVLGSDESIDKQHNILIFYDYYERLLLSARTKTCSSTE